MSFPLGKPILVMLLISLASGAAALFRHTPPDADLTFWLFADSHQRSYRTIKPEFEQQTGSSLDLQLITTRALNVRLTSLFMSAAKGSLQAGRRRSGSVIPMTVGGSTGTVDTRFFPFIGSPTSSPNRLTAADVDRILGQAARCRSAHATSAGGNDSDFILCHLLSLKKLAVGPPSGRPVQAFMTLGLGPR